MSADEDKTFYTVTMARVYADQGRNEEAARIYRYLLDRTPDRPDLQNALDDVLAKLPEAPGRWADIAGSVERWIRLMLRYNALRKLERTRLPSDAMDRR
jgi:tetratricopeptide (TPR) repeat protein